ncbi:hypothetical protein NHG37_27315, partial [Bacillus thuringiensis]|nr:hypothetical protein [Bacillus thuringiensis]
NANQKRAMKGTKLKQGFIVRYADDFKIMAKDFRTAQKWFFRDKNVSQGTIKVGHFTRKIQNNQP